MRCAHLRVIDRGVAIGGGGDLRRGSFPTPFLLLPRLVSGFRWDRGAGDGSVGEGGELAELPLERRLARELGRSTVEGRGAVLLDRHGFLRSSLLGSVQRREGNDGEAREG